ncbi:hypothetical protein evm_007037 [Chilo suppressalis]|nr:hypothetical protein evm_007037 [Chilo suppressalis]
MGRSKQSNLWTKVIWVTTIVKLAVFATALNVTTVSPPEMDNSLGGSYAWSSWGSWSSCSKTCGGGVAIQERQCLPRSRSAIPNGTLPPPIITVRVTRQTHLNDCAGVARRYHECNTAPCPDGEKDMRAEQCAVYDRRPFRGRFYTWTPYIDGDSPCTLNCRPLGQQFYASLALVADGTPCTRPGYRAICVQGECKQFSKNLERCSSNSTSQKIQSDCMSDFRPISILPFLSKVLERLIHNQISEYLRVNNLLIPIQSGFRPGYSTASALVKITDDIRFGLENQHFTALTLLDFSNAFNNVDFEILLSLLCSHISCGH